MGDIAIVYMVCEPESHYHHVMTRSRQRPVMIEQQI